MYLLGILQTMLRYFVSVKGGGAYHDSIVFAQSWLGVLLREGKSLAGFYIMGDAAYAIASHHNLLALWPGRALSCVKDSFNFWQSYARINIECAFGILVRKWLVLSRGIECEL